ncbi:MAG TPA: RNA methyltransferase [Spirochaetia bacterium]|nr:RNA methyltransferase [Spirochaetales bacterium]HPD80616.1 RNA methyltransferase [Spirochaetales bacterium]HRS64396.1 RNA methyltransferase [Spirochaetia bacterium]
MQTPGTPLDAGISTDTSKSDPQFSKAAVVLCRAEQGGNVGAVCRAMESMGFSRLTLVQCPDYDSNIVKMYALKSFWIYEQALRVDHLHDALGSYAYAAGFSRRIGARRQTSRNILDWAETQINRQTSFALVFGNEQNGLSTEELSCCDESIYIPTAEGQPSLNLAQAVQLALWECRRQVLLKSFLKHTSTITREVLETSIDTLLNRFEPFSVYKKQKKEDIKALMRSIFSRANCSQKELQRLFEFFEQVTAQIYIKKHPDSYKKT